MILSELIERLNGILKSEGDLEVCTIPLGGSMLSRTNNITVSVLRKENLETGIVKRSLSIHSNETA